MLTPLERFSNGVKKSGAIGGLKPLTRKTFLTGFADVDKTFG